MKNNKNKIELAQKLTDNLDIDSFFIGTLQRLPINLLELINDKVEYLISHRSLSKMIEESYSGPVEKKDEITFEEKAKELAKIHGSLGKIKATKELREWAANNNHLEKASLKTCYEAIDKEFKNGPTTI